MNADNTATQEMASPAASHMGSSRNEKEVDEDASLKLPTDAREASPNGKEADENQSSEAPVDPHDPHTVRSIHGWRWVVTVASLFIFALLYGLDTTIAADVQPAIVGTFGNVQELAWIGVGFPLGSVSVILPVAYSYGLFEIKTSIVVSIIIFEVGSAVCGASPTMNALIVGRVIAGIGGSGMYLGALNFIGVFTTLRERSFYNALMGLVWGLGTILGPVVGGLFAQLATWRWAFYINLVLAGIFGPPLLYLSPTKQPRPGMTVLQKLRSIDWLGAVLFAGMFVSFVLAFTFGGSTWAYGDGRFIATITVCGVLLVIFIVTQYFKVLCEERIFPAEFLRSRTMILLFIGTSTGATALFIGAYYIPLYFQFVHDDNPLEAAVRLLPFIIVVIVVVMINGATLPSVGYYFPWYLVSGVFMTTGGALMYTIGVDTATANVYGYSVLVGVGAGAIGQMGYVVTQAKAAPENVARAISFQNIAQIGGVVLALGIAGAIFQNESIDRLEAALGGFGFTSEQIKSAVSGTQSVIFEKGSAEVKRLALKALIGGMDQVFAMLIAAGALTLVVGLVIKKDKVVLPKVEL